MPGSVLFGQEIGLDVEGGVLSDDTVGVGVSPIGQQCGVADGLADGVVLVVGVRGVAVGVVLKETGEK